MSPKNRDANRSGSGQNGKNAQGPGKQPAPSLALAASPSSANGLVVTLTAVASDARTPTLSSSEQQAVDDLFSTMKQTLTTLGNTFDALGKQTVTVASISPRVAAARELQRTGEQLRERQRRQEARVEELKKALSTNVKDQQELLNKKADELVAEFVGKEVPSRVEKELTALISIDIKQQLTDYKRRILEVKVNLHNSEARRKNALLLGLSPGTEPLTPLLPPLAADKMKLPEHPALFPKTVGSLFQLNTVQLSALLKEYRIEECTEVEAASPLSPSVATREENLNRLMSFIGVGLFIPPLSATTENSPSGLKSPVVTRRHAWPSL
ncbi:hypothetical protein FOMPIDRAFT_101378 [Fomitopsis schrenkii]|uniref:Uncharacterized protein n=1 Tax=Fomitopsis schrenkii TaxID=2126942 RepID=S8EW82_FOMSC|nr:hypothetical protein FOMPIDRAFT_101378 [Fomitopsis schrenkii]